MKSVFNVRKMGKLMKYGLTIMIRFGGIFQRDILFVRKRNVGMRDGYENERGELRFFFVVYRGRRNVGM